MSPIFAETPPGSRSHSRRLTSNQGTCGMPCCCKTSLAIALSMANAEPSTLEPTYGIPASSSSPCTVPSSPIGPCSTGKTTSISAPRPLGSDCDVEETATSRVSTSGSAGPSSAKRGDDAVSCAIGSAPVSHCPSRVTPMGIASNRSSFSAPSTVCAERSETSCSPDCPPKMTATRTFRLVPSLLRGCPLMPHFLR